MGFVTSFGIGIGIRAWSTPTTDKEGLMACWLHSSKKEHSLDYCHKLAVKNEDGDVHLCPSPRYLHCDPTHSVSSQPPYILTVILVPYLLFYFFIVWGHACVCTWTHMCHSHCVEVIRDCSVCCNKLPKRNNLREEGLIPPTVSKVSVSLTCCGQRGGAN